MTLLMPLQKILELTRSNRLDEATQLIQKSLGGDAKDVHESAQAHYSKYSKRPLRPLGQVVQKLKELRLPRLPVADPVGRGHQKEVALAAGAKFLDGSFRCEAGTRSYKLYVPSHPASRPALIVMLHGCKQNPSDFALGTQMNGLAEKRGMLVLYPAQDQSFNPSSCWNWFDPQHQVAGRGEPAILAGLTAEIMKTYDVDRGKVFVAGLSAGGAMALVMGESYPDLFSGVGVHSGLPYKSAHDVISAFGAMRGNSNQASSVPKVRTIVFHGDRDATVAASNGADIFEKVAFPPQGRDQINGEFTRRVKKDESGRSQFEHWTLHGGGHAWSGGSPAGSFTQPSGPPASSEMLRFFLD